MENNKYMWILIIFFVFVIGLFFGGKLNIKLWFELKNFDVHFKIKILWKEIKGTYKLKKVSKENIKITKKGKRKGNFWQKIFKIVKIIKVRDIHLLFYIGFLFQEITFVSVAILGMLIPAIYHYSNGKNR